MAHPAPGRWRRATGLAEQLSSKTGLVTTEELRLALLRARLRTSSPAGIGR